MGKLIVIMGISASTKDTVMNALLDKYPSQIKRVVNNTTRPIREGIEIEGREYHFVTKEDFDNAVANNELIEHREYTVANGETYYYYIAKKDIDLEQGNHICIADVGGARELVRYFGTSNVKVVWLNVNPEICLQRALIRLSKSDSIREATALEHIKGIQEVCRRFVADIDDFILNTEVLELADYVVYSPNNAPGQVESYLKEKGIV